MINIFINGGDRKTGWVGHGYCLKEKEYIDFEKVIEGFSNNFELLFIGISIRNMYNG